MGSVWGKVRVVGRVNLLSASMELKEDLMFIDRFKSGAQDEAYLKGYSAGVEDTKAELLAQLVNKFYELNRKVDDLVEGRQLSVELRQLSVWSRLRRFMG